MASSGGGREGGRAVMHNGFRFASSNWIITLRSTAVVLVAWNHGQAYGHVLSAISRVLPLFARR